MRSYLVVFWLRGKPRAVSYRVKARTRTDALVSVSGHVELTIGRARVRGASVMELVELWGEEQTA